MLVLDASVIFKLFVTEKDSEKANKLFERFIKGEEEISEPSLIKYEVLNALKYRKVSPEKIKSAAIAMEKSGFTFVDFDDELASLTIDLALEYDITIYDAVYVALAKKSNAVLYTEDKELINKIPKQFVNSLDF